MDEALLAEIQAQAAALGAGGGGGGGGGGPGGPAPGQQRVTEEELQGANPLVMLLRSLLPWVDAGQQPGEGEEGGGDGDGGDGQQQQ
jgi:hypothetical protein